MKTFIEWGLRISVISYALLHFFTYFVKLELLQSILSVSGFFMLLFAGMIVTVRQFKLPLFLLFSSIIILIFSGSSFTEGFLRGFLQMRDIIGLLVVIPMISWILHEEPYVDAILQFAHNAIDTSRKFYIGMISFTQIIAYFLLFGAIPMMYQFINTILKRQKGEVWENFKGTALIRGFSLSTLWVVSIPSFTFAVEAMDAPLGLVILQGLGASICGIFIAIIFSRFEEKKYGLNLTTEIKTEIDAVLQNNGTRNLGIGKVSEFAFLFISLFGTIFLIHGFFPIDLMVIIPLVILLWTCLFFLFKKRVPSLIKNSKNHFQNDILNQSYQLSIMLGAGLLIYSLKQTGFSASVIHGVYRIQENVPYINTLYLLPFIFIILGFMGLGPLTVMVLVAGILESIALPYPPELIVLTITSGSVISILLSPVIMPVLILSASNGLGPIKNGIKFNWKFALVFYIVIQLYVQTMIHIF